MEENLEIRIIDKGYKITRDIYIFRQTHYGMDVLIGDSFKSFKQGEAIPDTPTLSLTPQALQKLADALSEQGIKPKQGFVEGKLEATEKHLEDMRTLLKVKPHQK